MKVFVINLADSYQRRDSIAKRLKELGCAYHFFDAIDGRDEWHPLFDRYDDDLRAKHRRRPLSGGELGCWASHHLLWEQCVQSGEPIIVMEDDVDIDDEFVSAMTVADQLVAELGYMRLAATKTRSYKELRKISHYTVTRYFRGPFGTQCYALSPAAAANFLKFSKAWYVAVDDFMDRYWAHGVDCLGLQPYHVKATTAPSDIRRLPSSAGTFFSKMRYELYKTRDIFSAVAYSLKKKF